MAVRCDARCGVGSMFKPALYVKAHYNPEDNTLSLKTQELARFIEVTATLSFICMRMTITKARAGQHLPHYRDSAVFFVGACFVTKCTRGSTVQGWRDIVRSVSFVFLSWLAYIVWSRV